METTLKTKFKAYPAVALLLADLKICEQNCI